MIVTIEFLGMQRQVTKTDSLDMPITGETRVSDVLEYIRQHYPDLSLADGMVLVTVNHETAASDRLLVANDRVSFLPIIGGG